MMSIYITRLLRFSSVTLSLCFLFLKVARSCGHSACGFMKWVEHASTSMFMLIALCISLTFLCVTEPQIYILYAPPHILEITCTIMPRVKALGNYGESLNIHNALLGHYKIDLDFSCPIGLCIPATTTTLTNDFKCSDHCLVKVKEYL